VSTRRSALVAVVLTLAALLSALAGPARASGATAAGGQLSRSSNPPPRTVADGTDGKIAAMAIPNVNQEDLGTEISRLKADGLNTVTLFVWWWADHQTDNSLYFRTGTSEPDAQLQAQIALAKQNGMSVMLVPIFYCGDCQGGWRGTMQPSDPNTWFAVTPCSENTRCSYTGFIDYYARLAAADGVQILFIGSEDTDLESDTSQWEGLADQVRGIYNGQIAYEENWDVLGQARFLDSVDLVGVSAYFPLDDARSPSLANLLSDWSNSQASATQGQDWVGKISRVANSTGKPIIFGEVGYLSSDYAARQPFLNYYSNVNWQLQSDLYQAVLQTFSSKPWWNGVSWFDWYVESKSAPQDNTRTPRDKTAETLLKDWYADGWRPANPSQPLVYAPPGTSPSDSEAQAQAAQGAQSNQATGGQAAAVPAGAHGARPLSAATPSTTPRVTTPAARNGPVAGGAAGAGYSGSRLPRRSPVILILAAIALVLVLAVMSGLSYSRPPRPRT